MTKLTNGAPLIKQKKEDLLENPKFWYWESEMDEITYLDQLFNVE